jgi:hypothetical protein
MGAFFDQHSQFSDDNQLLSGVHQRKGDFGTVSPIRSRAGGLSENFITIARPTIKFVHFRQA